MSTLRWASDGSRVSFNLPAAGNFTGALTFACLLRHRSIGAWSAIMNHGPLPTGASPAPNFEFDDLAHLVFDQVGTATVGPVASDVTNWYIVAITKAAGSTIPTFHYKRIDDASAWTHSAGSVALGNAPSQTGWLVNYGIWQASDQADMNLAVGAGWNASLTSLQVEALLTNKATTDWTGHAVPPVYVHQFTQQTSIPDLMGNGATWNSTVGTTVDAASDPPGWTFIGGSPTRPRLLVPASMLRPRHLIRPPIPGQRVILLSQMDRRQVAAGGPVAQDVGAAAIATSESWGAAAVQPQSVDVTTAGIASSEGWGAATVQPQAVDVTASSIPTSESWGAATVQPQAVNVTATGIATSESWGTAAVTSPASTITASSIGSSESWGAATMAPGAAPVTLSAIGSSQVWGNPRLDLNAAPASILSSEGWGAAAVQPGAVTVSTTSIPSSQSWGALTVPPPIATVTAASIPTAESWGALTVPPPTATVTTSSIPSSQSWGALTVAGNFIQPAGISSSESWGATVVQPAPWPIAAPSIPTAESWGSTRLGFTVTPSSIGTMEGWGATTIQPRYTITLASIPAAESWGATHAAPGPVDVGPAGIGSGESWGAQIVKPEWTAAPSSITTSESWGTVRAEYVITLPGIPAGEAWGAPAIITGPVDVAGVGIASSENWGGILVTAGFRLIKPGTFTLSAAGFDDGAPGRFTLGGGPARPIID